MMAALIGAASVAPIAAAQVMVRSRSQNAVVVDLGAINDAEAADRQRYYGMRGVRTPGVPYPVVRPDKAPAAPVPAPSRSGAATGTSFVAVLPAPVILPAPPTLTPAASLPLDVDPALVFAPDPLPRPAGPGASIAGSSVIEPPLTVASPPSPLPSQRAQGQPTLTASSDPVVTDAASADQVTIVLAREIQQPDPAMFASLTPLVEVLTTDKSRRIRINSVATDDSDDPVRTRHLALRRALAARSFLMDAGVHPSQIVLNVTGDTTSARPADQLVFSLLP